MKRENMKYRKKPVVIDAVQCGLPTTQTLEKEDSLLHDN